MSFARAMTRGFTLIEMAIVLVVIGLVLSGGLMAVSPILASTKVTQTNAKLDTIEKALTLYVIQNGCLPCPTDGSDTTNTEGLAEGDTPATYANGCADTRGGDCEVTDGTAVVPWGALGLTRDDVTDAWGGYITYVVDDELVENSTSMVRTPPSDYPDGDLVVQTAASGAITSAAAYVLISHGNDRRGAWVQAGTQMATTAGNTSQNNNAAGVCGATPCHQDMPIDVDGATKFDDVVRWRTAPMIIQLCGTNACGNPA